ncbi:MAG: aspartate aminotransferase family protein [Spirochaetia bacterium]|nr:aspartate aminotransferase family protein [Spirochaetia bacterium]
MKWKVPETESQKESRLKDVDQSRDLAPGDKPDRQFSQPLSFEEIKEKSDKFLVNNIKRAPVAFYFGQGEYLYDTNNKRYLDFLSGVAVTSLGHGDADFVEALREQSDRVIHTSNLFYNQELALLAEALVTYSFPGRAFLCNSGTEANEAAFKLARLHGQKKGNANRIVTLENSFHGRTVAGMSMTGQAKIHKGFGPLLDHMHYIAPNDVDMLEKEIDQNGHEICALVLELVQGEGGVKPLDLEYVRLARKLTQENDILLILDEIQTGMGRTGKLFAYEHFGIIPDAITLAKALGNGFPVGAMIIAEKHCDLIHPGIHGTTFGGNHLAARVAYETLKIIVTRDLLDNVVALSDYFFRRLQAAQIAIPVIKEVRGMGLHIGIELDRPGAAVVDTCRDRGLLVNCTNETTIRLVPPLNISLESAADGLEILEGVLRELK